MGIEERDLMKGKKGGMSWENITEKLFGEQ
jgi:hypothetical protein